MIEVKIPFAPNGEICEAYTYAIKTSKSPWVILLDHDAIFMHPNWYSLCVNAVKQFPEAGMFTCWASKIGAKEQQAEGSPINVAPLAIHRDFARNLWQKHKFTVEEIFSHVSGVMMMIRKDVFLKVGCKKGFFGVDWDLTKRIREAGFKIYRINGLYVYHLRDREPSWIENEKVSKDYKGA